MLNYAARIGLRTAFIFYDALPMKYDLYGSMRAAHSDYMSDLGRANLVIPISEVSAQDLRFHLARHASTPRPNIIPIHLPAELIGTARTVDAPERCGRAPLILSVGTIDSRKNQLTLVRAFAELLKERPAFAGRLVLAGNLSSEIAPLLKRHLNDPRIEFLPAPDDTILKDLYRQCSFTVFPSLEEGFGLPILESLWFGKPCICANFGAMAEVSAGGGCIAIDVHSTDAILAALRQLLEDPNQYAKYVREARNRVLKSWRQYASEIQAVLDSTT